MKVLAILFSSLTFFFARHKELDFGWSHKMRPSAQEN